MPCCCRSGKAWVLQGTGSSSQPARGRHGSAFGAWSSERRTCRARGSLRMTPKMGRASEPPTLTRFTPRSSSRGSLNGLPARPMTTLTGASTSFTSLPMVSAPSIPGTWRQSAPAFRQETALAAASSNGFGCPERQHSALAVSAKGKGGDHRRLDEPMNVMFAPCPLH